MFRLHGKYMKRTKKGCRVNGLTLMEMIIAMAVIAIVFAALVPQFNNIYNSWDSKQALAQTIQNGRVLTDHIRLNLSKAVEVTDVSPPSQNLGYIQFKNQDGTESRYQLTDDNMVQFGTPENLKTLAGPVSCFNFNCYHLQDLQNQTQEVVNTQFVKIQCELANSGNGPDRAFPIIVYLLSVNPDEQSNPAPALAVDESITLYSESYIDGFRSSNGPYGGTNIIGDVTVSINSTLPQRVLLTSESYIDGNVLVGPSGNPDVVIQLWGQSEIKGETGVLDEKIEMPQLSEPPSMPPSSGTKYFYGLARTWNTDQHFNSLEIGADITVVGDIKVLCEGNVTFNSNGKIIISDNSSLEFYVKGSLSTNSTSKLNYNTADPGKLKIYMLGYNKNFQLNSNSIVYALVQNPYGNLVSNGNTGFCGTFIGNKIETTTKSAFHIDLDYVE